MVPGTTLSKKNHSQDLQIGVSSREVNGANIPDMVTTGISAHTHKHCHVNTQTYS